MITHQRKLRTDGTLWQHMRAPRVPHRALTRDTSAEVLIVGAGITGAMIADALVEAGLETIIVDRRRPTHGSTVASTALVAYEIDMPLSELQGKIGKRDAIARVAALAPRGRESRKLFRRTRARGAVAVLALSRGQQPRRARSQGRGRLAPRGRHRNRVSRSCRVARPLRHRSRRRAARARQSHHQSARGDRALADPGAKLGTRIYAPAEIANLGAARSGWIATTKEGRRIRCKHIVFASGYEFPKFVPMKGHKIRTTWAFATRPQPRKLWPEQCLVWEASEPYLYARTTPDGRVLCGGEDEDFSDAV